MSAAPRGAVWAAATLLLGCAHAPGAPSREGSPGGLTAAGSLPKRVLAADPADFQAAPDVVVLHYYGAGGWGILWRGTYLLAAPYFSNHGIERQLASLASRLTPLLPNDKAIRAGFAGTPVAKTKLLLLGHGHIDHAADVPGFFGPGLLQGRPALLADRSTTNLLAPIADRFGCVAPIDYGSEEEAAAKCALEGIRVVPLHHAHAPHVNPLGLEVSAFAGSVDEPRTTLPATTAEYPAGNTWAFLIDLLDARGEIAFRIHYADAAATRPHGIIPKRLAAGRDVDLLIACVPGFEQSEGYPEALLRQHNVRYVMAAHWEDFFQPRDAPLKPLRLVLDEEAVGRFVDVVERAVPVARGVAPLNKGPGRCKGRDRCGPHGPAWTLPIPGETFQFRTALAAASLGQP